MNKLYLLGSGVPTPTKTRFGTSCVLEIAGDFLMFDCGPAATYKLVKAGLWPTQVEHLFFTHHHFDHNVDYPCFLLCRWDQSTGKEKTLKVWGPPPTKQITDRLTGEKGAFVDDWKARVGSPCSQAVHRNRGGSLPRPEPRFEVADVGPGLVVETQTWKVTAAPALHMQPWLESLAYRVDADGLSVLFAGDTGPCESLTRLAAGCGVFVANCWDDQDEMNANGEAPGQTGTRDAANMAKEAGAKKLVLIHTGARLCSPKFRRKGLADITHIYEGEVIFGKELMTLDL